MTTPPDDIAKLSERLRRSWIGNDGYLVEPSRREIEAATALDALSARVKELEAHNKRLGQGGAERYWEERYRDEVICAEVAERKLTEAIEALKSLIAICERNIYPQPDEPESYWAKLCAARAVTGE